MPSSCFARSRTWLASRFRSDRDGPGGDRARPPPASTQLALAVSAAYAIGAGVTSSTAAGALR
jgi:hypothetical protein